MSLLQIDVEGIDADGNVATATIEVEVIDPGAPVAAGAGSVSVVPRPVQTSATMNPGIVETTSELPVARHPNLAAGGETQALAFKFGDKPVTIPGLGNGVQSGHIGAQPTAPAPKVTQAVRSMTMLRNTGGYR